MISIPVFIVFPACNDTKRAFTCFSEMSNDDNGRIATGFGVRWPDERKTWPLNSQPADFVSSRPIASTKESSARLPLSGAFHILHRVAQASETAVKTLQKPGNGLIVVTHIESGTVGQSLA